jgi:rhodanese-related sulfurtransferase
VRNPEEQESSGIIDGALSIPLPELESRINELKGKKNIILNCMTGVRATAAYSVLVKHDIPCYVLKEGTQNVYFRLQRVQEQRSQPDEFQG